MSDASPAPPSPPVSTAAIDWPDAARAQAFADWLARIGPAQQLRPDSLRVASADASFRRYFRLDTEDGATRIVMDAPPAQEDSAPFVHVAGLMQAAGLRAPRVLDWERDHGFLLLTDLGRRTMMEAIDPARPDANQGLYLQAVDLLLRWQQASRPGVLPPYDEALLRRELTLFPDWYIARHRGIELDGAMRQTLESTFDLIVARNLAAPAVYVHRDFMPRNLMVMDDRIEPSPDRPKATRAPSGGSADTSVRSVGAHELGVLDFQDAVHGPLSYDIASLMRDAFLSWEEEFVLDITVRYWERARKLGLMDFEDWHSDFGSFWRAVEWMGLQRHLKVAGIFARLTLRDGKPRYLADTPRFIAYIRHTAARYRELAPLLKLVDQIEGTEAASGWVIGRG